MNDLLQNKLNQLKNAADYECWYLVKQPTEFAKLCYLVCALEDFQKNHQNENLETFINNKIASIQKTVGEIELSNNYRALRAAAFFGLITMSGTNYKNALITQTYNEICDRCNSKFENIELYTDIIDRQIEKIFLSSDIDEGNNSVRKDFRLYPVMLLYKVLIELGRTTGEYKISLTEYKFLVATTKKFEDFLDTLLQIKLLREDKFAPAEFEKYASKFDNRMLQALKQLNTLIVDSKSISINPNKMEEVAQKVFIFENNASMFADDNYLDFLGSTRALIELDSHDSITELNDDSILTPEWFKQEAEQLGTIDEEAEELYKEFKEHFSPETLKSLDGLDLLHKIFLNETNNKDSLCYVLEYDKRFNIFGSVAGGSAYKYGLFYSKNNRAWMSGTSARQKKLTQEEAINLGQQIRNEIVSGAEIIANYGEIADLKDYANLNAKLYEVMPNTINKSWVIMYYHMMFPQIFPVFYNEEWQRKVLDKIRIEAEQSSFIRMGQIALFAKNCGISNVAFSKIVTKADFPTFANETSNYSEQLILDYSYDSSINGAQNIVIYGTPGCGKSFYVQNTLLNKFGVKEGNRIRTTFYQDYTNTDFVGQILPRIHDDKSVTYEFNPGPFAIALKKAIEAPEICVALIIEELNRGNAASIFGDIFQLLDRDETGKSRYGITNVYLQDYLNDYFKDRNFSFSNIYIPSNLYIIATMNTSDQNVFTLDTAFKRRWQFEKIRNEFKNDHEYKGYYIPGMNQITWENLATSVNEYIVDSSNELSSEDKQLGVYFIDKNTLCETLEDCKNEEKKKKFAYKLFEYLWDDVAKFSRSDWFGVDIKSLDQLIDAYLKNGEKVFVDGIIKQSDEN